MAGSDDSEDTKAQPAPGEPRVLGRREVLKGLSTVPALGLFGYAWQRQRQYQQSRAEEGVAAGEGSRRRAAGDQRRAARGRGPGPGAHRRDAANPRPPLPRGLRRLDRIQPAPRRQQPEAVQARGERLRGLPRDARQGEGARRGHYRDAGLLARAARDRLPRGGQARLLREGNVEHARGCAEHGGRRTQERQPAADRPSAALEPALPALLREAPAGGEAARPDRDGPRAMEPRRDAGPRGSRPLRHPGWHG